MMLRRPNAFSGFGPARLGCNPLGARVAQDDLDQVAGDSLGSAAEAAAGAFAATMAHDAVQSNPQLAEDARAFLREQSRLAKLQSQSLVEQNAFELSHLRWRRFNDRMRGLTWVLSLFVGATVVVGFIALLWSAHVAHGLVVQPISTPPDLSAKGLDGTVLAQRLLDKLNGLVAESDAAAYHAADTISGDWGDQSRVEIPETGVSISEFSREMRNWLGSETHLGGAVWHSPRGFALTVRAGANPAITLEGNEADLDALLGRAAESLLRQTQPSRYAALLLQRNRVSELMAFASGVAHTGSPADKPWAYQFWALALASTGRYREALPLTTEAIALDPSDPSTYYLQGGILIVLDRERDIRTMQSSLRETLADPRSVSSTALAGMRAGGAETDCILVADFNCAAKASETMGELTWEAYNDDDDLLTASYLAQAHDVAGAVTRLAGHPAWTDATAIRQSVSSGLQLPFFFVHAERGEWRRAVADLSVADRMTSSNPSLTDVRHTLVWPWLAFALAKDGRTAEATGLVAATPLDCTTCLSMRGRIAALRGDPIGADHWFGIATANAPDWPFSFTNWGEALLRRGDADGAITKFEQAHERGPHFADPLELWGEALVMKNRSDLALAKFEEASHYAPNWGRLHLKWGEALLWSGDGDGARRQFAMASTLALTPAEQVELARVKARG
jgi:tetratricopeptide (TPR) repeat protein